MKHLINSEADTQVPTMFTDPEYFPVISQHLSQVFDDIGVNPQTVQIRQQTALRKEKLHTIVLENTKPFPKHTFYYFGSQSEGTTTSGLNSDEDQVHCDNAMNVIQDWSEWCRGKHTMLMIQDETTAPGYCRLQIVRSDVPLPAEDWPEPAVCDLSSRRLLLPNRYFHTVHGQIVIHGPLKATVLSENRNGPAHTMEATIGCRATDKVRAYRCKLWPRAARPWLLRHRYHQWPSQSTLRMAEESGCFLVPVGHRLSEDEYLEWRISPSLAERYLMFSLNITQVRCYIVLKMIVKTFIRPRLQECISSFHCKTILFWCVENTSNAFWQGRNLVTCVWYCLYKLLQCIKRNYCPQYMIPGENLFAGKLDRSKIYPLIKIVNNIFLSNGRVLFEIKIDNIGHRLTQKCNNVHPSTYAISSDSWSVANAAIGESKKMSKAIQHAMIATSADNVNSHINDMRTLIRKLLPYLTQGRDTLQKEAVSQFLPFLYTTLGSLMASASLSQEKCIPWQALFYFACGIDSDVSSSRLKLASALYCRGDLNNAERVLREIDQRYDKFYNMTVCGCSLHENKGLKSFTEKISRHDPCTRYTAFCVRFLRNEMSCVPPELWYEMFRSTADDVKHRDENDVWMDWAVVDSLLYLFYLQYMTYRKLGKENEQKGALDNLYNFSTHDIVLFHHRETSLNLLGMCMELEDLIVDAFECYRQSLEIRSRNNAAKWHIARLMWQLVQNHALP